MWHRQRVAPNPAAVHMSVRVALTGRLDVPALRAAVDGVVAGTRPCGPGWWSATARRPGGARAGARPAGGRCLDAADVDAARSRRGAWRTGREPFPATDGPWLHARLARLAGDRWVLIMIVHHLCGDGWSMAPTPATR